jgi:hypothetical protein
MPTPTIPSGRRPYAAAGLAYDGKTKDFVINSDGQCVGVHPVDEQMALSLTVRRGSCKSSPELGNTLHEIKYLGGDKLQAEVKSRVLSAYPLSRLVSEGKATVTRVEIKTSGSRLEVATYYVNNQTADARELTSHEKRLDWYG